MQKIFAILVYNQRMQYSTTRDRRVERIPTHGFPILAQCSDYKSKLCKKENANEFCYCRFLRSVMHYDWLTRMSFRFALQITHYSAHDYTHPLVESHLHWKPFRFLDICLLYKWSLYTNVFDISCNFQ